MATRVLVVAAILGAGFLLVRLSDDVPAPVGRGGVAPGFSLPELGGAATIDLADTRGQVVLLNFWATWCEPCRDEMPSMERLYQGLRGRDFEMLAISVDEDPALVDAFRTELGITFPILLDPNQKISKLYQTMGFPESLLVDRDGFLVERYVGPRDWDHPSYAERIVRLLEGAKSQQK